MRIRERCRQRLSCPPDIRWGHAVYTDRSKWALFALLFLGFVHVHGWLLPRSPRTVSRASAPYKSTYKYATPKLSPHILLGKKNEHEEDRHHLEEDLAQRVSLSKETVQRGKPDEVKKHLEEDLAKRLSLSALSQPTNATQAEPKKRTKKNGRTTMKPPQHKSSSFFPPPPSRKKKTKANSDKASYSSLLPPPLPSLQSEEADSSSLSSGLSSWEEFLGRADSDTSTDEKRLLPKQQKKKKKKAKPASDSDSLQLPSISDLFPPNLKKESPPSSGQALDGVLPVSELFYRSSQAIEGDEKKASASEEGDDEELPFSAEQSDELTTDGNKVRIRRNRAVSNKKRPKPKKHRGRKLVRRGMEMFLGGVPINADPPQRSVELTYKEPVEDEEEGEWSDVITLNTRDFGPLLYTGGADSVNQVELGLFCENFVSSTMKWDVCPKDLRDIAKNYMLRERSPEMEETVQVQPEPDEHPESHPIADGASVSIEMVNGDDDEEDSDELPIETDLLRKADENDDSVLSLLRKTDDSDSKTSADGMKIVRIIDTDKSPRRRGRKSSAKGFGKKQEKSKAGASNTSEQRWRLVGFALKFCIGVSKPDLEMGDSGGTGSVLRGVLRRGIMNVLKSKLEGLIVRINKLQLHEDDDGSTTVMIEFSLDGKGDVPDEEIEKRGVRIDASLGQAMDDGDFALALAAAAREETSWPDEIRDRVVEEFLMEDDEVSAPWEEPEEPNGVNGSTKKETEKTQPKQAQQQSPPENDDRPFGVNDRLAYSEDDLFLGGGNGGVFFDYSESNIANAPYKGELGPLLVDSVTARAVQRHPRVIAIGDVHGCIDELQELLRLCDYRPGDLVVFLGDLVCKGPDSISVVQLAREIGAIAVRGNHDFEVIRWHQAIKSGVDPPVVGSEHFHIASCLTQADMKWMYSLPWYLSSKELGALFVHAGFVSGIRLSKQNPRLMMNMRSILPDGTVTSKFFSHWPWARLWDGPQTVLFGHDADRGLQQYEHAIGLDTGCVYGGRLTACILPEKRLVSVSARREYFKYRRKHYD